MTQYFVSASGSDSNNGMSIGSPWQTLTPVNAGVYNGGDTINFRGGDTFGGGTAGIVLTTSSYGSSPAPSAGAPVTFQSYGTGQATISSGTVEGFHSVNIGAISIQNLIFVGSSATTSATNGISIQNTTNVAHIPYIRINGCDVSLYGFNGIKIENSSGSFAFSDVVVSNTIVHNAGGGTNTGHHNSGITVQGGLNATASNCVTHHILGNNAASGCDGMLFNQVGGSALTEINGGACGILITNCLAHDIGATSANPATGGGPTGIFINASAKGVIQFCEPYNVFAPGGIDGDGIDLGDFCTGCIVQYCWVHDNDGPGILIDAESATPSDNNTIRYCILQNNGAGTLAVNAGPANICVQAELATFVLSNVKVYNNTIYNGNGGMGIKIGMSSGSITGGRVNNNIIYTTGTGTLVNTTTNPGVTFDGNDYFASGTFAIAWNGTTYSTLASWKTALGMETVNGGFTANPLLNNAGGGAATNGYAPTSLVAYALISGSTMIGAGLDLNSHFSINPGAQDYFGNRIPNGGNYNVGAWGAGVFTPGKKTSLPLSMVVNV